MYQDNLFEILKNEDYFNNEKYLNDLISILHNLVFNGNIKKIYKFIQLLNNHNKVEYVINNYNDNGETALHIAVNNNYQNIAELLIHFGARIDLVDKHGQKVVWVPEQKGGNNHKLYGKRFT
jgi:ankyrin repeat protein